MNDVAFAPGGRWAVSASDDRSLIVWDLASGTALHRLAGHEAKVVALAVSHDGRLVASAGWDRRIGLWDLASGAHLGWLEGHGDNVTDVAFSQDDSQLWSAGSDGAVRRWRIADRSEQAVFLEQGFGINRIVLDEADGWLAYGALDGSLRVVALADGSLRADLSGPRKPILALALSDDGALLAVGDGEGWIETFDTADWSLHRAFRAVARGPVWALAFAPGGRRLLAGSLSERIDIWPLAAAESVPAAAATAETGAISNGERRFAQNCAICHSLEPDGARRAGPTLFGLFGRRAGAVEGYVYSDALADSDIIWNAEMVDRLFEVGPANFAPGTKMPMQRIVDPQDRADLIDYLEQATEPQEQQP